MATFSGQLRSNEIFSALYNMIISQEVFGDNIKGTNALVDMARVDGGLQGDTKLFYATDALSSSAWGNDAEAQNLLALHRPSAPSVQAIVLDQFRQISLTVDNYLSKRAWSTEGAFSQFNSVMLGWVRETKRIYDSTIYNAFIGTAASEVGKQTIEVALSDVSATGEEGNREKASMIAKAVADLYVELEDVSRDYNDYGYIRSYAKDEIKVIWNADYVNKLKKVDIPTIFNAEGLLPEFKHVLPAKYFGVVQATQVSAAQNTTAHKYRALVEYTFGTTHCFPGEYVPTGVIIPANTAYEVKDDVICKVYVKLPPFMSAFEVGTSFFNAKSLTENHYLTFSHNTMEYLKGYPCITVYAD